MSPLTNVPVGAAAAGPAAARSQCVGSRYQYKTIPAHRLAGVDALEDRRNHFFRTMVQIVHTISFEQQIISDWQLLIIF